jgi:hypothetical protein
MVDDCIRIERTRENGKVEKFSKPQDVIKLGEKVNAQKRFDRVKSVFPTVEAYCQKLPWSVNLNQFLLTKSASNRNADEQKHDFTKTRKKRQPKQK